MMKLKCIHDDGCPYWTKGDIYQSSEDRFGFPFVEDDERIGFQWFLVDNADGTYSPAGITYRVNFIIED